MSGFFGWFSWVVSLGLAGWVAADAKRRTDSRWAVWALLAFMFPWVFGPLYWFVIKKDRGAMLTPSASSAGGRRLHAGPAVPQSEVDEAIAKMAAEIAGAANAAARADLIRMIGRGWADAVSTETKAGGLATVRVLIESTAEAVGRDDIAKAQEQMDKALSHVRGGARRHPGGRMILAGLAQVAEASTKGPAAKPARARSGQPAPEPAKPKPNPAVEQSLMPGSDVPAFITARQAPDVPTHREGLRDLSPSEGIPLHTPPSSASKPAEVEPVIPPAAQPWAASGPRPARQVPRTSGEPLDVFSTRVAALAGRWLAEVGDQAPAMDRSYARVKLESAASAVYRGDFRRACEMVDEAASLVPANGNAASSLRASLHEALEAQAS